MTVVEARVIAAEYDAARTAMQVALARFERARRAYASLPLYFEPEPAFIGPVRDQMAEHFNANPGAFND